MSELRRVLFALRAAMLQLPRRDSYGGLYRRHGMPRLRENPVRSVHDGLQAMSRLDQIRDRLQHATWGQWKTVAIPEAESELATPTGEPVPHVDLYVERLRVEVQRNEPGTFVGYVDCAGKPDAENVACIVGATEADVALLRDAPSDLRYLLACVEALREVVQLSKTELLRARQFQMLSECAGALNHIDAALHDLEAP